MNRTSETETPEEDEEGGSSKIYDSNLELPNDFDDDRVGFVRLPNNKPSHVSLIYRNLQSGLCTDMEIKFSDNVFQCHHWIVDAFMNIDNLERESTTKEKFIVEYICCLKAPELPMLLRAYYQRSSDTQDFNVTIGQEQFKCHYDVLRCYTDFFDKHKRFETIVFPKSEVSIRAFFMIYRGWMLDQITEFPIRGISEVYKAAKYLRISILMTAIAIAVEKIAIEKVELENEVPRETPKLLNKMCIEKAHGISEN